MLLLFANRQFFILFCLIKYTMKITANNVKNIQLQTLGSFVPKQKNVEKNNDSFTSYSLNFAGAMNSIEVQAKTLEDNKLFEDFLSKPGKVTVAEYEDISKNHIGMFNKCAQMFENESLYTKPQSTAKCAIALKNHFDDLYGSDNYLVVSIGTSPAAICETMQNIGTKTVFLPATGLGRLQKVIKDNPIEGTIAQNYPNVQALMDYVDSKGEIKDVEHIVLLDYENCGHSLKTMEKIFLERGDLQESQVHRCSMINTLSEIYNNKDKSGTFSLEYSDVDDLKFALSLSKVEKVSNVPHFEVNHNLSSTQTVENDITDLIGPSEELFSRFDSFSKPLARAWSLCSLHEAMKLLN